MLQFKQASLQPLFDSQEGLHMTAYVRNSGTVLELRRQLREAVEVAKSYLSPILGHEEIKKFLEPVDKLINDTRMLKSMRHNIAIFRTKDKCRFLSIPVAVETMCVVATSFHVKPLLRWLQTDRDFLLLGFEDNMATLYQGTQTSLEIIDTILYPGVAPITNDDSYEGLKRERDRRLQMGRTLEWMNEWIYRLTATTQPRLYLAGNSDLVRSFVKKTRYPQLYPAAVAAHFSNNKLAEVCAEVRRLARMETKIELQNAIFEFYAAEDSDLAKNNIFQIARLAVLGKVKKLIVADGIQIFGKLDRKTGGIALHAADLDHEDDDLLDDLAQTVLAAGGEVIVAERDKIPKGRPVLAIVNGEPEDLPLTRVDGIAHLPRQVVS